MDNTDFSYFSEGSGEIRISAEVISGIALKVCTDPDGIAYSETQNTIKKSINKVMAKPDRCKIDIGKADDGKCIITATVIVTPGGNIPDAALKAQTKIKDEVELLTGVKVSQVNIYVSGISTD